MFYALKSKGKYVGLLVNVDIRTEACKEINVSPEAELVLWSKEEMEK